MNYRPLEKMLYEAVPIIDGRRKEGKGRYLAYNRMLTFNWQMWSVCRSWKNKTKHFGVIRVKIRSGRNHQWMQYLRGHVDEKQDICITLKRLSVECLLLVGSTKKQH